MANLHVRIMRLELMKVASFRITSETPEYDAWEKMYTWAEPKGLYSQVVYFKSLAYSS